RVDITSNQNLSARCFARLLEEQWKQAMRGGGGDDFKSAAFPQFTKRGKQIAFVFIDKEAPGSSKDFEIKVCELAELWVIAIPFSFTRSEIDQQIEMPHV